MSAQRRVLAREAGTSTHPLRTLLLLLAALLAGLGLLVVAPEASAHHSTGKVTFCHATSSSTHPYVEITTDPASIVRAGHDQHTGPVWSPTLGAHQAWGDVIPSFTWVDSHGVSHRYAGLNTDRLDVVAAGCVVPPVAVTVTAPTAADQTCEASGTVTAAPPLPPRTASPPGRTPSRRAPSPATPSPDPRRGPSPSHRAPAATSSS